MKGQLAVDDLTPIQRAKNAVADLGSWGAERGYHPDQITDPLRVGGLFTTPLWWSDDFAWRVREASHLGEPLCFRCVQARARWDESQPLGVPFPPRFCQATRRFLADCGIPRSDSRGPL